MDEIQRVLVKAGRKDLAQKYYEKVAAKFVVTHEMLKRIMKELDNTNKIKDLKRTSQNTVTWKQVYTERDDEIPEEVISYKLHDDGTLVTQSTSIRRDEKKITSEKELKGAIRDVTYDVWKALD